MSLQYLDTSCVVKYLMHTAIKMHNSLGRPGIVHREVTYGWLSLETTLIWRTTMPFYSESGALY
jgi:hypothetical protein